MNTVKKTETKSQLVFQITSMTMAIKHVVIIITQTTATPVNVTKTDIRSRLWMICQFELLTWQAPTWKLLKDLQYKASPQGENMIHHTCSCEISEHTFPSDVKVKMCREQPPHTMKEHNGCMKSLRKSKRCIGQVLMSLISTSMFDPVWELNSFTESIADRCCTSESKHHSKA